VCLRTPPKKNKFENCFSFILLLFFFSGVLLQSFHFVACGMGFQVAQTMHILYIYLYTNKHTCMYIVHATRQVTNEASNQTPCNTLLFFLFIIFCCQHQLLIKICLNLIAFTGSGVASQLLLLLFWLLSIDCCCGATEMWVTSRVVVVVA